MATHLKVSLAQQRLDILENDRVVRSYIVSTARNGPGEKKGSECTPRGLHRIRARIGAGAPIYSVFVGRRQTGEIYCAELARKYPDRDWILSRILWLSGLEPGRNRFDEVDTAWRYIYIHGSPDHLVRGFPDSHGCIRMKNADVIELFDRVPSGTRVWIE
ncbi:MAG: L,D-transpeptidase [Methylococcaceae bacterium]|nr:L,D-transpeptidase [Methylococcaceae bacterium]